MRGRIEQESSVRLLRRLGAVLTVEWALIAFD
jgi:hypothetical protein